MRVPGLARGRAGRGIILLAAALSMACGSGFGAQAAELSVLTSYASSVYEPYRRAFESKHPGIRLKISNRKTTSAVAILLDSTREHGDVLWASSPDAFAVLSQSHRLERLPAPFPRDWRIGGFPIDDPDGRYAGFAISGYGLVWNEAILESRRASAPQSIAALADRQYRGLLGMTTPSRSGTTHLMVESVLQARGWEEGWATWLEIAGNLATITARSYSVSLGVEQGRFAIGMSIDFLGRAQTPGNPLRFAYPAENVFLPASVAIIAGTRQRIAAETFVQFLVSDEGQSLLQDPAIGRMSVNPSALAGQPGDPYALAAELFPARFDAALSGRRYELVNLLFDEAVTYRLPVLQGLWARVQDAEGASLSHEARNGVAKARRLLGAMPVGEAEARDPDVTNNLTRVPWGVTSPLPQAALVASWRAFFEANVAQATEMLDALNIGHDGP